MKLKTSEICVYGILGALTFVLKIIMSPLPNIEPVSLLTIVYAIVFGMKAIYPISIYIALEILLYGLGVWSIGYLYVWFVLIFVVICVHNTIHSTNALLWAIISGAYGLFMGALYIPLYVITGNVAFAITWWVSGIPYDIVHCISNFILCILSFKPIMSAISKFTKQYKIN